eukprot:TRINITY_DN6643_c0_g2_i1.p1 TRINITY_DN6643_c0_g2~~TRINITY_DN6643_c0_g2_i1.p1  ORF type:complete len:418 (+),score=65.47 TRINITY_DN6643_c0_g2_i1:119-1372(+)
MPLQSFAMPSSKDFRDIMKDRGHDFWVSCAANATMQEMQGCINSVRVEGELASEIFSHCYIKEADDIRGAANELFDEFGLGLRRKRINGSPAKGCIFVFVNNGGLSVLGRWRESMDSKDKRLSTEERVRREQHMFEVSSMVEIEREMSRANHQFWLTSYTGVDAETCKKRLVTCTVEGQLALERFGRCLITEVQDCQKATERLTTRKGLGLRKAMVRSKFGRGCVALLLPGNDSSNGCTKRPHDTIAMPATSSGDAASPSDAKRRALHGCWDKAKLQDTNANGDAVLKPPASVPAADVAIPVLPLKQEKDQRRASKVPADAGATAEKLDPAKISSVVLQGPPPDPVGDLHYRQVQVLEGRIAKLLPTLSQSQFSTEYIQERLEEMMQKPKGRLEKFKMDIGRIWRAWLDDRLAEDVF